jgi:LacI family gluconate utilization system Gnt-I transcriptional repressor
MSIANAGYNTRMIGSFSRKKRDQDALYKVIEQRIFTAIAEGKLKPGERLPPAAQLAKSWGLSVGTLRQALQILAARGIVLRRPKFGTCVNPDLELKPGEESWSSASPQRHKAIEQSNCIAMVVPDVINADYATVMRGAESAAESANLNVVVGNSEDDQVRLNQVVRQQINRNVVGLIILTGKQMSLDFEVIREIQDAHVAVVACYRPIGLVEWPVVQSDGLYNTHLIARHLCDLGYKHIALYDFATDSELELQFKRNGRMGFILALNESGINPAPNLYLEYPLGASPKGRDYYVITDVEVDVVVNWLRQNPKVDAVLCVLPRLAAIVVQAIRKLGLNIPGDIAVAGMGEDGHLFGLGVDWLTTAQDKWSDVGRRACELLLSIHRGEPLPSGNIVLLKGTLAIGGSTDPSRSAKSALVQG